MGSWDLRHGMRYRQSLDRSRVQPDRKGSYGATQCHRDYLKACLGALFAGEPSLRTERPPHHATTQDLCSFPSAKAEAQITGGIARGELACWTVGGRRGQHMTVRQPANDHNNIVLQIYRPPWSVAQTPDGIASTGVHCLVRRKDRTPRLDRCAAGNGRCSPCSGQPGAADRIKSESIYADDLPAAQREDAMTRLSDLPPAQAKRLAEVECPTFTTQPWVSGPPLSDRRVAIVSSAGLFKRGTEPFPRPRCRLSRHPRRRRLARPAHQPYLNQLRPHRAAGRLERRLSACDRLKELVAQGVIGSLADTHYSFMGASDPIAMGPMPANSRPPKQEEVDLAPPHPRLTHLHARRERARTLPGGRRPRDGRDQPDLSRNPKNQTAPRALGPVRIGTSLWAAERRASSNA